MTATFCHGALCLRKASIFSERSNTMMMTMSSDTAKKKVPMNLRNM